MTDKRIADLTAASSPVDADVIALDQAAGTRKLGLSSLFAYLQSKFGTAAGKDFPASGNASNTQVVLGSDTRLADTRTPSALSVVTGTIADGAVTEPKIADGAVAFAKLKAGLVGTGANTLAAGNDSRIVNADAFAAAYRDDQHRFPVASGEETLSRATTLVGTTSLTSGTPIFSYFTARSAGPRQTVKWRQGAAAGAATFGWQVGLYRVENNDDLTLLSAAPAQTGQTLNAANGERSETLAAGQTLVPGQRYAIGFLPTTASLPIQVLAGGSPGDWFAAPRMSAAGPGAQSTLPSTVVAANLVATSRVIRLTLS